MINFFKYLLLYSVSLILGLCLFVSIHRMSLDFGFDYLFLNSLICLLLSSLLLLIIIVFFIKSCIDTFAGSKDVIIIIVLNLSICWNIYGMFPFNVSRSNSVIILNHAYLMQTVGATKIDYINVVESVYIKDYDAVGIRLKEQVASGNMRELDGKYFITEKGEIVAEIFLCISNLFNVKNNFFSDVKCRYD